MDELKHLDEQEAASKPASSPASAKTKPNWILAGKIALGAICVLATIVSLSRLGSDQMSKFWESLADYGPFTYAIVGLVIVTIFLLFGLYLCGGKRTRRALLPICILMPVHVVLIPWTILLAVPLNLVLLLALIPCVIEAVTRKKPLIGIAVVLCAIYLLVGLYACYDFWTGFDFPRN